MENMKNIKNMEDTSSESVVDIEAEGVDDAGDKDSSSVEVDEVELLIANNENLSKVREILEEEKWTKPSIDTYTKEYFANLESIIDKAFEDGLEDTLKDMCLVYVNSPQKPVSSLYLHGAISLRKDAFDLSALHKLIQKFRDHKKNDIAEYLANRILEKDRSDVFSLNSLKYIYEVDKRIDDLHKLWERIAKFNFEDADTVKKLADFRLSAGDEKEAISYYKMALKRYARKKDNRDHMSIVGELWEVLIEYIPEDTDFFYYVEKELSAEGHNDVIPDLLKKNLEYAEANEKTDYAIDVLIRMLHYNPTDKSMRERLISNYKIKYKDHSQLQECLRSSYLNQTWKNFDVALEIFQKKIAFDTGNYVYHRSWGIGKIKELTESHMIIDFPNKPNHKMTSSMALTSLTVLPPDHLWLVKKNDLESLKDDSQEGIERTLTILLRSFGNEASRKMIKDELVPDVIPDKSPWTRWWTKAKRSIKMSEFIGQSPNKKDVFILRDKPLTYEEESLNNFRNVKIFDDKFNIFLDFLNTTTKDLDSEEFTEMVSYFTDVCNSSESIDDKVIKSLLILGKVKKEKSGVSMATKINLSVLSDVDIESISSVYSKIDNLDFKKLFLNNIRSLRSDWELVYREIAVSQGLDKSHNYIFEELLKKSKFESIKAVLTHFMEVQRSDLEGYLWAVKNMFTYEDKGLFSLTGVDKKQIIFTLVRILDMVHKNVENKKQVNVNRRLHGQIGELLVEDGILYDLIDELKREDDRDESRKLASLIKGTVSFSEKVKSSILGQIYNAFPDLEQIEVKKDSIFDSFFVTKKAYDTKVEKLEHIKTIEIPQNSIDIGLAQEKGDLSENAEYQSAMDKQKMLMSDVVILEKELAEARVIDFDTIDDSKVSIGTTVHLLNIDNDNPEVYTILGEWDSNLENNVISYKSPFGRSLVSGNFNKGAEIKFEHAGNKKIYKVLAIEKAKKEEYGY